MAGLLPSGEIGSGVGSGSRFEVWWNFKLVWLGNFVVMQVRHWRLSLYPNGDNKSKGSGFISLYLAINETENLPSIWEVHVTFRLFVLDQILDKFVTIEDGTVKTFNWLKSEWGFAQLVSWSRLMTLPMDTSSVIVAYLGQRKLKVYPKGDVKSKGNELAVFLGSVEADKLPPKQKIYAEHKLRVRDQINDNQIEKKAEHWFGATSVSWGYPRFGLLSVLQDASNGYLLNDCLIVEAAITLVSKIKRFSSKEMFYLA
ncbi:hypothetical protein DITRI_Ditri13aG0016000 [Diplodiscus trichospermus]